MIILRRSRQKFADFASGLGTIRTIEDVYAAHGFELPANFQLPPSGRRRAVCAAAEQGIDPNDAEAAERLLRVYVDAIDDWGHNTGVLGEPAEGLTDSAQALVRALQRDGAPIGDDAKLVFIATATVIPVEQFDRLDEPQVLLQHLQRINDNVSCDPAAAIGSAKELVESTFKFVLDDYGVKYDARSASLTDLYKLVAKELRLNRESVPDSAKGSQASHRILQNLSTAVQSLAELRNELGLGHGRTVPSQALARHARLAANAAQTVVDFTLATWHERKSQ
jgi:hypothetical protein